MEDHGEKWPGKSVLHTEVPACQCSGTLVQLILQPFGKNVADSSEILDYPLDKIRALHLYLA